VKAKLLGKKNATIKQRVPEILEYRQFRKRARTLPGRMLKSRLAIPLEEQLIWSLALLRLDRKL